VDAEHAGQQALDLPGGELDTCPGTRRLIVAGASKAYVNSSGSRALHRLAMRRIWA